jgi:hypothetical protein
MNRYIGLLLISIISLDLSANNPFGDDLPTSNYIELQDMTIHPPLINDSHPQVPYHSLATSTCHNPENDLSRTIPTSSTIQRRIFNNTFPQEQGFLILLKTCLSCSCYSKPQAVSIPNDAL